MWMFYALGWRPARVANPENQYSPGNYILELTELSNISDATKQKLFD